jgi:hypothetical protein
MRISVYVDVRQRDLDDHGIDMQHFSKLYLYGASQL